MLGNTLSTVTSSGPVGTLTDGVGDKVLVPVVSMAEGLTGKVGSTTGLGAPVKGLIKGMTNAVGDTGDKVSDI
ncbi:collagen-like triple helix repeat-containing protein, partial [Stenotrophomonas maltophilia]